MAFCHLLCHLPTFSSFTHSLLSLSLIKTDRLFSAGKICFLLDFHYELSAFFFFYFLQVAFCQLLLVSMCFISSHQRDRRFLTAENVPEVSSPR